MPSTPALQAAFSVGLIPLSRVWRRRIDERLAGFGLSEATAGALVQISRTGGGARQGAIADVLGIVGPSVVRLLDQLCAAGLVERRDEPGDRRAKTIYLTQAGEALAARLETVLTELRTDFLASVTAEDLAACARVFRAVGETLDCRFPLPAVDAAP